MYKYGAISGEGILQRTVVTPFLSTFTGVGPLNCAFRDWTFRRWSSVPVRKLLLEDTSQRVLFTLIFYFQLIPSFTLIIDIMFQSANRFTIEIKIKSRVYDSKIERASMIIQKT